MSINSEKLFHDHLSNPYASLVIALILHISDISGSITYRGGFKQHNTAWDLKELDPAGRALDRKAPTLCHGKNCGFPDDKPGLSRTSTFSDRRSPKPPIRPASTLFLACPTQGYHPNSYGHVGQVLPSCRDKTSSFELHWSGKSRLSCYWCGS